MKFPRILATFQICLALAPLWSCRQAPKRSDGASLVQQKSPLDPSCLVPSRLYFGPRQEVSTALSLLELERAGGVADDSDFSLSLVPSDFDRARALSCTPSTCEVAISKPLTLSRESKVELTANLYLKYQTTLDEKGALVSRKVSIGGKKAHISVGKILGVDVEVGAFLKQDLKKKGFGSLSSGTFVEANTKSQLPLVNLRGQVVAEGLNLYDLHVRDGSMTFVRTKSDKPPLGPTINSKGTTDLRDGMLDKGGKAQVGTPDFTWDTLAGQCAEAFFSP